MLFIMLILQTQTLIWGGSRMYNLGRGGGGFAVGMYSLVPGVVCFRS